jgi:hypothetical protein
LRVPLQLPCFHTAASSGVTDTPCAATEATTTASVIDRVFGQRRCQPVADGVQRVVNQANAAYAKPGDQPALLGI